MRHAHSGKIPFDCPFFSTAGHTLTGQSVMLGCSKYLALPTVCPLARRKKGRMGFCYVRYCRGAGSGLAVLTLALVEGLCRLQASCAINQQNTCDHARHPRQRLNGLSTVQRAFRLLHPPPCPVARTPTLPKNPPYIKGGQGGFTPLTPRGFHRRDYCLFLQSL